MINYIKQILASRSGKPNSKIIVGIIGFIIGAIGFLLGIDWRSLLVWMIADTSFFGLSSYDNTTSLRSNSIDTKTETITTTSNKTTEINIADITKQLNNVVKTLKKK